MSASDIYPDAPVRAMWGRADDGAVARIDVVGASLGVLDGYWPPEGLTRLRTPPPEVPALVTQADTSDPLSLAQMESDLGLFAAELLADAVAIHAAVIQAGTRVLVFPGPSLTGKTTLCVAAMDLGYSVLTDEYALVNPQSGRMRGWARPVRIRTDAGWERHLVVQPHAERAATLIATLTYSSDFTQGALSIRECEPSEVVLDLIANTVCARSRPDFALNAAVTLARTTPGIRGVRGEAHRALPALMELAEHAKID